MCTDLDRLAFKSALTINDPFQSCLSMLIFRHLDTLRTIKLLYLTDIEGRATNDNKTAWMK